MSTKLTKIGMNKMYLVLGDWSDDGHGKHDKVLLQSNISVNEIQNAYKASCKLTGVSFNDNDDYTESNRSWEDRGEYQVCVEYENNTLSDTVFKVLTKFGLTKKLLNSFGTEDMMGEDDEICLYEESYVNLWIWFVKLSLPKDAVIEKVDVKDEIPVINGYWNKNLNVQFGYGLYY